MQPKNSSLLLSAAIAGIVGASAVSTPALAKGKNAEMGLCKGANSCSGKSACGEAKGTNSCKGHGSAMMSKAQCEKKHLTWMPAPAMDDKKMDEKKADSPGT